MAREFSVVVGINATKAIAGGRQFKTGADQVNRSNRGMQRSTAKTTKRMTAMITTLGRFRGVASLAFAGFLGVGGIGAVIRTLATFQQSMSNVEALLGDRGVGGAMASLTNKARELGATTAFTASQAAEGMKFLTLAGFDALEVFQAIGPALDLAQAGALGLGQAADIVSNIMQGFNINASKTAEVVDALAFVASRSNTNIQQLGQAMKFVAPVAGALNLSVQEVSAALGLLGNSGLQASLAGTGLRRVLSGLLNPSKEAAKVLGSMGLRSEELVEALQDPKKGLTFVLKELEDAGLGAAEAFTLFGQRGAPALLSLLGQTGKLEEFNEQMKDIAGTAKTIGAVMIDNIAGDARIAISALQEAILRLGDAGLTEWLEEATQAFTGFIRGLSGVEQNLENSTDKIRRWAAAGEFMRENATNLRTALVVLVAFMNRGLLISITTAIGRFVLLGATVAGLAGPFAIANASGLLLVGTMSLLRAAIIATGVGALVVAAGFLLDWILFSEEAETQNDKLTASYNKQKREIEGLAFEFETLNEERKRFAVQDLAIFIQGEEIALIRMTRQLKNADTANIQLTQANLDVAAAQERVNAVLKINAGLHSDQFAAGSESQLALIEREGALLRQAEAELLLGTTAGVTASTLADQKQVVEDLTLRLAAQVSVYAGLDDTVADYIARINGATDAQEAWKESLKGQVGLTEAQIISLSDLVKKYSKTQKKIADMTDSLDTLNIAGENATRIEKEMGLEAGTLARVHGELTFALNKAKQAMSAFQKETIKMSDKNAILLAGTDKVKVAQIKHTTALRDHVLAMIALGTATPEMVAAINAMNKAHEENIETLRNACEETDKLKNCMDENSKAMEALWDQAMRNIQDSFADAFRNIGDGFDDFADSILDAFKDLLANMAAQAAINNIFGGGGGFFNDFFGGLSGSLGEQTAGGAAGSAAGGGGLGGAAGAIGGITGAFAAVLAATETFFIGAGTFLSGSATSTQIGAVNGTAGLGAAAAGAGIGALSGGLVDGILGGRGDPGVTVGLSAIGGAIGSIWGPIGSIIGGAIGSFASNLFGGAKKLESATLEFGATAEGFNAVVESVVSKQRSFFRGRSFTTTRTDVDTGTFDEALDAVISRLVATGEALGVDIETALAGFSFTREIDIAGKTEEQIAVLVADLFNDVIVGVIDEFIDNVEGLSDRLSVTVGSFRGNTEEFIRAFELAASIDLAFLTDPVTAVTNAIETENKTLKSSYDELITAYRGLIQEYDGSLPALEELAIATNIVVQAQTALVAALITVGDEISTLFQGSAQTIREALLSEEELFNLRKSQIDELVAQASQTTDPEELSRLAAEINRLGLDAFNLLDEEQRAALGPEFIEFFEGLDDLFGDQIAEGIGNVVQDQADLDIEVANAMTDAAQAIIDAQVAARQLYDQWREDIEGRRDRREYAP